MDTLQAFAMGSASRGNPKKVFDWDKAARLIKESGAQYASAGLSKDWDWTADTIWAEGKIPDDSSPYLASTWATPQLYLDGDFVDCYIMEAETEWNSKTFWPKTARDIVTGE
ncbi:MAG: hypothetical protein AAGA46_03120 [Cyanobacteria bacterium P01_F01_bin.13]